MIFTITAAGQLAANNANGAGPKINLTSFRVTDATGYTPNPSLTSVPGNVLHTGQVTSYMVIDAASVEFTCIMDETVGTFTFGTLALYLDNGTLFAISCLDSPRLKKANGAGGEGDSIAVIARLNYTNLTTAFSFSQQTLAEAKMLEVSGVHMLQPPAISPANAYITHSTTGSGDPVVAFRMGDWEWGFTQFVRIGTFTVSASSTLSVTATGVTAATAGTVTNNYLIQFTSGDFKGYARMVDSSSADVITWLNALTTGPLAGSTFSLYRSHGSFLATTIAPDLSNYYTKPEADARFLTSIPIGFIAPMRRLSVPEGWLLCDGRTIGNSGSGATARANADCLTLFTYIWAESDNVIAPIQDSRGGLTWRGNSAGEDFAAGKRIPLDDLQGEFIRGLDLNRGVDPNRPIGGSQADDFKSHTHQLWIEFGGNVDHQSMVRSQNADESISSDPSDCTGPTGGTETRPRNKAYPYYIRYK